MDEKTSVYSLGVVSVANLGEVEVSKLLNPVDVGSLVMRNAQHLAHLRVSKGEGAVHCSLWPVRS